MAKKKTTDLFQDVKVDESADFGTLFEQSMNKATRSLKVGDSFKGEVLSIGADESFISTGTTQDAILMTADLKNDEGKIQFPVGTVIDAIVTRIKGDEIRVVRKGAKGSPADVESLEDAFDMELPLEGKVTEVVNGGYRVQIQGQLAFCPFSQIDSRPVSDPASMVGKKFEFMITQFDAKKKNIVVSRRRILDLQKAENEGQWLEKNKVGDLVTGRVSKIETFGAFIDLDGGAEGLVHISEIGFIRLKHPSEALNVGDPVQVKILKIDEEQDRLKISLSIKQAGGVGDPWMQVPTLFPQGAIVKGTVDKKEVFGLFVQLQPGITGLLPKSKWKDSPESGEFENKKKGDSIQVRIDEIKFEERRISLGLPTEAQDDSWKQFQSAQSFGALAAAFGNAQKKK